MKATLRPGLNMLPYSYLEHPGKDTVALLAEHISARMVSYMLQKLQRWGATGAVRVLPSAWAEIH